jgi:hypothetical protein
VATETPIAAGMKELIHLSPFWSETSGSEVLRQNEIHAWLVGVDDRSFCIRCDQLDEVEIVLTDHVVRVKGTIPNLSLIELTVYAGYVAALVVDGVESRLTYYAWESPSK